MPREDLHEVTELLERWGVGDEEAEGRLWSLAYVELKRLARNVRRGRGGSQSGTTTLVHETYLRLAGSATTARFKDRRHFFAVAARAMRFLLVDEARRRLAKKRNGEEPAGELLPLAVDPATDPLRQAPETVLAVHEALEKLARIYPRYEQLVEMRFFAGLSIDETAEVLEVSRPTVIRDWRSVRIWLYSELRATDQPRCFP